MTNDDFAPIDNSNVPPRPAPAEMVDALNDTFGRHPGKRASHAKGFCATGTFVPDAGAWNFANSAFFQSQTADAVLRFSVGGGNPGISDKSRTVRGMGLRMTAGHESWDLVMVSEPVFFAATPESFVSFLEARVPDPVTKKPDPAKVAAHNQRFPDGKLQPALLAGHAAPRSYAQASYFTNNAFLFKGASGRSQMARISVEPAQGVRYLSEEEEASFPDNFLVDELATRMSSGPIEFEIWAQLPAADDSPSDPSQRWLGTKRVKLGMLHVNGMAPLGSCDGLVFSPINLPKAIAPSNDPILASRHAAYGVSSARRRMQRQQTNP